VAPRRGRVGSADDLDAAGLCDDLAGDRDGGRRVVPADRDHRPLPSVGLGLVLWIGFCATQWVGSIMGEDVPVTLAAIHARDWLLHMLIMSVIIGLWR